MAKYTLVIDQGGHSTRALVFNKKGLPLAYSSEPITDPVVNSKLRIEYAIAPIIDATQQLLQRLLPQLSAEKTAKLNAAVFIAQRSSLVACDKTGKAICNMISWQDTRNADWLAEQKIEIERYQQLSGLRLNAHMGASKIRWLLDHDELIQQHAAENNLCFMPWGAYFLQKIAQTKQEDSHSKEPQPQELQVKGFQLISDPILAARTGLVEYGQQQWSQTLLELFDIPENVLPTIVPSTHDYGSLQLNEKRIPILLSGGDQNFIPCAYGTKKKQKNIFVNMGTGVFIQALGQTALSTPLLKTAIASETDHNEENNTLEGTVNAAASLLEWWQAQLDRPFSYGEIDQLLDENSTNKNNEAPILINTLAGTGSPYWLGQQEPVFLETENSSSNEQKTVAVIESILFACKINIDLLRKHNPALNKIIISGGLARSNALCQRLANLTNMTVRRYDDTEASSRGAAFYLHKKKKYQPKNKPSLFKPDQQNDVNQALQQRFTQYESAMQALHKKTHQQD